MAKKGIAVPYIIALILGIVVVGVIGYWFFTTTSIGGGSASIALCNSKKSQWCNDWSRTGYLGGGPSLLGSWDSFAPGCTSLGVAEPSAPTCRALTGTLLASGATCTVDSECQSGTCSPTRKCPSGYSYDTGDGLCHDRSDDTIVVDPLGECE